jgi:hypothetical protein
VSLRAQKGLAQRLYVNVYSTAGAAANPTTDAISVSVAITRLSDGSTVVASDSATYNDDPGVFYYDLSPADSTSAIDQLTVTWSYTLDGVAQTQTDTVDVVGNRLCHPRAIDDSLNRGGTAANYTARQLNVALTVAENLFEQATETAWTTRYCRETKDGPSLWRGYTWRRAHTLFLANYPVVSVRSATQDGTALTADELAALVVDRNTGRLYNPSCWHAGHGNIVVDYEYGHADTPPLVSRAVALVATSILADAPFDDRGFGVTTDGGFVRLLTAGVGGALFSIPEVQAAVKSLGRAPAERILGVDAG